MRTLLLFLLLAAWGGHAYAQVSRVEYFFDTDPGAGKGIPLSVQPGNQTGGNFQLPMGNLSNGFHTLFIRAANTVGLWSHTSSAQFFLQETSVPQINATEYFLDTDPGEGKGTSVNVSSSPTGSAFFVPLTNVSGGMHTLFIRTRDNNGRWSHVNSQTFYVQPHPGSSAPAIEYFIDNDPGTGKATLVNVPTNGSLNTIIPLNNTAVGFHTLGIRVKDDQGRWGHTQLSAFFVHERNDVQIDRIEYYFQNTSDTSATYTYKVPQPSASVSLDFSADLSGLQGESEYTMFLYAVTNTGVKSLVHSKQVKVCGGAVAEAKFGYIAMGTEISFIDSSRGATKYRWDFGDGSIDSVSNPVHKYAEGGNYTVKLVVENFCNKDTVEQIVNALTLQSVYPNKGGNTGSVTVSILGGGFGPTSKAVLKKGGVEVEAKQIMVSENGKSLEAQFDLYETSAGGYDLVVQSGVNSGTLPQAFQVEQGKPHSFKIEIEGRDQARRNVPQTFTLTVSNLGNIDAKGLPIWFSVPRGSVVKFGFDVLAVKNTPDLSYDTIPFFFEEDSLFGVPDKADVYGFILKNLPASQALSYKLDITLADGGEIKTWTGMPFFGSPFKPEQSQCLKDIFKEVYMYYYQELYDLLPPEAECFMRASTGIVDFALGTVSDVGETIEKYENGDRTKRVIMVGEILAKDIVYSTSQYMVALYESCYKAQMGVNPPSIKAKLARKHIPFKVLRTISRASGVLTVLAVGYDLWQIGSTVWEKSASCRQAIQGSPVYKKAVQVVASFDPNEKTGPSGSTAQHYTQGNAPFNYTIFFENVDTATAPAQEVIIVDTLDKSKFDLSSFQVTSYGFADSSYKAPPGLNAYAGQTLFRRAAKPDMHVRFNARLDTSSGVITWRFLSIDPLTRELTDDPLDGFLAPNKKKGEGEGFVSFSIKLKPGFSTGTAIRNKALIYFDNNKPIVTNEYLNTIDVTAPQSRVNTLPAQTPDTSFTVKWSGSDAHAGIRGYDVYVAVNNGPFKLWHFDIAATEAVFTGQKDSTYRFYSIAKDYAGNTEAGKTGAEATVKIVPNAITPVDDINNPGLVFQVRPNPVAANAFVFLKLPQTEDVSITLLDAHGRVVELVTKGMKAAGEHQLPLKHDALQRGIYLLKLQSRTYQKTIRIMK